MTSTPHAHRFADRHIGPHHEDIVHMLSVIGADSMDQLVREAVPESILDTELPDLPPAMAEGEAMDTLERIARNNEWYTSLIGAGYHATVTPPVLRRNILESPGWYTAYTPYQAEISQGRLEMLVNFQTVIIDLTGMDIANASMLDEATAAAEAMTMLRRLDKSDRAGFFVDAGAHPQTIEVVQTRAEPLGIKVTVGDPHRDVIDDDTFGVLLQYPTTYGAIHDPEPLIEQLHERDIRVAVASDLLALCLLSAPGEMGADIVVGSSQRFGVHMMFGGPHAGFFATRDEYKRAMPGRLVGASIDSAGRTAYRLALSTREQHIRREKATSNICTAQVLLAVMAGAYAVYHGPDGLREIARRIHTLTSSFVAAVRAGGLEIASSTWFDTVVVEVPGRAAEVIAAAEDRRINLRPIDADRVGLSFDEISRPAIADAVLESLLVDGSVADHPDAPSGLPADLLRTTEFLTHPTFHNHRTETEMMRYLRRLRDKDIALDRSMIPLGSCTMKLNAAAEMVPITWPEFSRLHPFAPLEQATGYLQLFEDLEKWLAELTGYAAVSLQPNAGSQGEYAGLLAIRNYHASRGDTHRRICLIPASAHGTNPASAVMAGMDVVVVATAEDGSIDLDDLRAKAKEHANDLAALMITYPSTHGVFEEDVREVCEVVHEAGGQVYIDGANLNALLGVARFGAFGGDVSHLNLHKTFTIPHGGGGPGVGPIGVAAHLEPFLPGHPLVPDQAGFRDGIGAVSAAPWGSAGILPIPWMYIAMMGADGLREATHLAILNANYIAARLEEHFPVLYRGERGRVAHECIIDVRDFKKTAGVTVDDVAKRLIDFGFHAPTMSFPVAGTLMIEPTESESLAELDRFCEAMITIREEIAAIEAGEIAVEDSPLRHAPHTAEEVMADDWDRVYTREQAAYPLPWIRSDKYWPPVGRVDNQYGDRNVQCACPPLSAYEK